MTRENGLIWHEIEIDKLELAADDFTAQLQGGDVASYLNGFSSFVTEFVKTQIMREFTPDMRASLVESINGLMHTKTTTIKVP